MPTQETIQKIPIHNPNGTTQQTSSKPNKEKQKQIFTGERKRGTFGERNDVVILEAKTTGAVAEALTDDVSNGILPPTVRVTARDCICFSPAHKLCLPIEEPRP